MITPAPTKYEVLRTPNGKWFWWPSLQCVDYVQKGKQRIGITINLPDRKNNEAGAVLAAIRSELKSRRKDTKQMKTVIFGTDPEHCNVVVEDEYASGIHAKVTQDEAGQVWVEDLESTNGTWIQWRRGPEVRVLTKTLLEPGTNVRIGRTLIPWTLETGPATERERQPVKKYNNLAELKAAYASGELPNDVPLVLDNDSSWVYLDGKKVYQGGGYELREEALTLLGIPWEPC